MSRRPAPSSRVSPVGEDAYAQSGADHLADAPEGGSPGTDVRLGSGTAVALASQAVGLVASVLVSMLVARSLGPAGKGALSVVQQAVAIAFVFANLGYATSNVYFISKRIIEPSTAIGNSLALAAVATLIAAVPVSLLLYGPFAVLPGLPPRITAVAIALFAAQLLLSWVGAIVIGLRGLKPQAAAAVVSTGVSTTIVVSLYLMQRLTVSAVLGAGVLGSLGGLAMMLYWARGRIGKPSVDVSALRQTARHSLRVHVASIADFLHMRQDVLLLGWLAGSSAVGLYSVGVSFAELAWYIPNAIGQAIQAQASRVSHEAALDFAARSLRVSVLITGAILVGLLLVVPWALPLLFGSDFTPSVTVFLVLLPGAALTGLTNVALYYQMSRAVVYWRVALLVVAVNVVANVAVIPVWGAVGAASASTLSYALYFAMIMRRMARDGGLSLRELLLPTAQDVRILLRTVQEYVASVLR